MEIKKNICNKREEIKNSDDLKDKKEIRKEYIL